MFAFILAQTAGSQDWLESIRQSELTPWIGGALLIFIGFSLIKMIAKAIGRVVVAMVCVAAGFFGWQWWEDHPRTLSDIKGDWTASVKKMEFTPTSVEEFLKTSGQLLNETLDVARAKGREASKETLTAMARELEAKVKEAAANSHAEAKAKCQAMLDKVRRQLRDSN